MNEKAIAQSGLEALVKDGAEKAQVIFVTSKKQELNVESGEISLLRTTFNTDMRMTAIKDQQRGIINLNKIGKSEIKKAAKTALNLAEASEKDSAYDISEKQPPCTFDNAIKEPDLDAMYYRMAEFLKEAGQLYPRIVFENLYLDFTRRTEYFLNSNNVDFTASDGIYNFTAMFTAKEGKKSSSFNYSCVATLDLSKKLLSLGLLNTLLQQSSEQIETRPVPEKFVGDVVITPNCLEGLIDGVVDSWLKDYALISGTSIYKDKIGKQIADTGFTLRSMPVSKQIANGYFITQDGYKAENLAIIDRGILKTFLLSLYGSKKTGKPMAPNSGGCYVIDPGDKSLDELIGNTKQGVLLARFSGGQPNDNGDFSAVAKNSYYIENGKVKYPIRETMISGNIAQMLMNIKGISKERVDFGNRVSPWVSCSGLTISGGDK